MKRLPLISVCFFCRRRHSIGVVDDGIHSMFDRGFTGHQHLHEFGLINMNGRLYDPVLARFLSPDPYLQAPDNLQNHNRYSYALNNPLRYTDPSGEWIHLAIGAFIGGVVNWAAHGAQFTWEGLGYFGIGAAAGALGAGIGMGVNVGIVGGSFGAGFMGTATVSSTGFIAGAATGASGGFAGGFLNGFGNATMEGQNIGTMLVSGLKEGGIGAAFGAVFGGITGGIHAEKNERNFLTGNAKTYEGTPALYANLDGGSEVYLDADDYSVFNASGKDVYYKPEDGVYGVKNRIPNGHGIRLDVDGVATSKYTSQVFKIPGKSGYYPSAYVNIGGDVTLDFSAKAWFALKYQQFIDPNYSYGWMTLNELDKEWEMLFELAGRIK